jgi:hypothetical protein
MSPNSGCHQRAHEDLVCGLVGVAYCGVDLVNDTDTTMVVDSVMVVPNGEP